MSAPQGQASEQQQKHGSRPGSRRNFRDMSREEQISRALSKTLRHQAKQQQIPMTKDGYCLIDDIIGSPSYRKFNLTRADVVHAVETNAKKRYELSDDGQSIRAVQGHTIDVEVSSLEPLTLTTLPPTLVHGTTHDAWNQIKNSGLNKMKRLHIHMASGLPGEVISGMRSNSAVLVYVNGPKAYSDGIQFFRATNGAILSPGKGGVIAPKYFSRVIDARTSSSLL